MPRKFYTVVALLVAILAQYSLAAWDGTKKIPKTVTRNDSLFYEITSPEEFVGYFDEVLLTEPVSGVHAYLKNDIVFGADSSKLSDKVLNFKRKSFHYFNSVFDGCGHFIYGLRSVHSLFPDLRGKVINLNIANSSFGGDTVSRAAAVAEVHQGLIQNVHLYNTNVRAANVAGGIVANAETDRVYLSVDRIILNSSVNGGRVEAAWQVGGIAANSSISIMGCSNSATIRYAKSKIVDKSLDSIVYMGGIVGFFGGTMRGAGIVNCVNRGLIDLDASVGTSYAGGIVGSAVGNLENLQNEGRVWASVLYEKGVDSAYASVGGIAGMLGRAGSSYVETRDFLNKGVVSVNMDKRLAVGKINIGGIAGLMDSIGICNALNLDSVKVSGLALKQEVNAGGVVGFADYRSSDFSRLKNRGVVYAKSAYSVYAGGVVGWLESRLKVGPSLRQAFNYGHVSGVIADSSENAETLAVGGIAGGVNNVMIRDVYNRGKLSANGKLVSGAGNVGGIVGFYSSPATYVKNAYSDVFVLKGDSIDGVVGGIVGYLQDGGVPVNAYFDGSAGNIECLGKSNVDGGGDDCLRNKAFLLSEEMLDALNTENGTVDDRRLWVNRGGYSILSFDSLYKNDSMFFDFDRFEIPPSKADWDTVVYTISTPKQMEFFLEMAAFFNNNDKIKVVLANDIVMGIDSTHLSKRKLSTDFSYSVQMNFDGNGHTIYGLNMSRAMFYQLYKPSIIQNLTIANSRFENELGLSAAAIVLENGATIKNVTVRNSLVRGGDVVGGVAALNADYSYMENVRNENTSVYSSNKAGGIVGEDRQSDFNGVSNSGKVFGRMAGGITGYSYIYSGNFTGGSNSGTVLASGKDSVFAGGIAGYSRGMKYGNCLNTGLVEASSDAGVVFAGGIAGKVDSASHISGFGNWGRVHIKSGKNGYAGGLFGMMRGRAGGFSDGDSVAMMYLYDAFNYGPVVVRSVKENSIAGGLVGYLSWTIFPRGYNRGIVKNEGPSSKKWTGGMVSIAVGSSMKEGYCVTDTLTGDGVGVYAYDLQKYYGLDSFYYVKNLVDIPLVAKKSDDASSAIANYEVKTFEEMKTDSLAFLQGDEWIRGNCLPRIKLDTTSTCALHVVKDYFDTDFTDHVGFLEDVVYADSADVGGSHGSGDITSVTTKLVAPSMQVEVSARNIAVSGLSGNHAVFVFDLQGRLVSSAQSYGTVVNFAVPRAGRYVVRCGSQTRLVMVY